ncbi:MAG: bifunctional phosphopantothenoylcysteine decarboxylase/phosphopantothenate--cysteine ligase CoaBC [Armatimonadetes bacterium]|nr:bifunctional phosphopantothenoylcysteine decarboxylase/phosphopantothenate--cysteine ligase CoaBC [Armatimonadota bacterium]
MTGKTIVLGIGGGIACYKIADLASKITQNGADVHAVLTHSATKFIAPLTFQALTHNPALSSLWSEENNLESGKSAGMPHIALADGADLILIAPATADLLARLAGGLGDDLLTTLVLATRAPVAIAPAMNPTMLAHPATQKNLETLRALGYRIIEPDEGRMACEHIGSGRLPETAELLAHIEAILFPNLDLAGKTVVITAGPTRESLDPVRYLTNRSSGKMGYALAEVAARRGAKVTLVSGPTNVQTPQKVEKIGVETALQMLEATQNAFQSADIMIAAAAPADFRARCIEPQKIKRGACKTAEISLIANPDIVAQCAANKRAGQIVVGFAAETQNLMKEARKKLNSKNLDAIVANDVTQAGAGFDVETNRVTWITAQTAQEWPLATKTEVAARIWDEILKF